MTQFSAAHDSDIKALILDYGEVLCSRPTQEHIERMAGIFGLNASRFMELYPRHRRAYDRGDLSAESYWSSFADEPGVSIKGDQIALLRAWDVEMWSNTDPVMLEWAEAVHQSGMRTALLSNMQADMIHRVQRDFSWINNFDCLVFSHEQRLAKPEAQIYQCCLERLGTAPGQALFIDDRDVNVRAAQDLGIQAIRFESMSQLRAELEKVQFPILPALAPPLPDLSNRSDI